MDTKDKKIIQDFLAGDNDSYAEIINKYLKPVYNFLRTYIRDSDTLDDLTQETFIKAWKNIKHYDQKKNFKTWIFAIAKNTAYDYLKKKKTIPFSEFTNNEGENVLENIKVEEIVPLEILEKAEKENLFEKKLEKLPTDYRVLLLLRYKEDFSLKEISKILNIPDNTAKSRHIRALENFKKILS